MYHEYLSITNLFVDSYFHNDNYKIITVNNEPIITADTVKILTAANAGNPRVKYFIKLLKDIAKSTVGLRRYLIVMIHFLIVFKPNCEKKNLIMGIKKVKKEIDEILEREKVEVQREDFFKLACKGCPEYVWQGLEKIMDFDGISVWKIKK